MNIQELEKQIKLISEGNPIKEQEIINGLKAYLDTKYQSKEHSAEDLIIIEEIKEKIGRTLMNASRQRITVNHGTKYNELFDLDELEVKLVERAWDEMESEGDVASIKHEISLTEQGIRKFRK